MKKQSKPQRRKERRESAKKISCFCEHFGVEGCRAEMREFSRERLIYCPTSDIYVHPGSAVGEWLLTILDFQF